MDKKQDNGKTVSLTIAHLKPSMILAEDALNNLGVTVLPKGTKLDNVNFDRLRRNQVVHVSILADSISESQKTFIDNVETPIPKIKTNSDNNKNSQIKDKDFEKFDTVYKKKIDELKDSLSAIEKGEKVDIEPLYSIVDGIVGVVNSKSDLVSYISYLNGLDDFTYYHSVNVSIYCNILASWLKMDKEEMKFVSIAGLLHDIGKSKMNDEILEKTQNIPESDLNEDEFREVKKHPEYGYKMLRNQDIDEEVKKAVLMHHERMDGSGYPMGIKGEKINKFARIVAICDAYDSRISREKIFPLFVIKDFKHDNYGIFDTEYLIRFAENIVYSYNGTDVTLSNGKTGKVVYIDIKHPDRPIVEVDGNLIDLSQDKSIYIKQS